MAAARSIGSVTLLLGLVTVPVKIFTAQPDKGKVSFNQIVAKTNARVKVVKLDDSNDAPVTNEDLVHGYEYSPGQFVTFTDAELKALEAEGNPSQINLREIVPLATVDSLHLGPAKYLGPDKGSAKSFALIAKLLNDRGAAAVGQRGGQRRDSLVLVRAQEHALVMHECLYDDEVKSVSETIPPVPYTFAVEELELGNRLFDAVAMPDFAPARFRDRGLERILAAVERKRAGNEIVIPAPNSVGAAAPLQLLEQLRLSVPASGKKPGVAKTGPKSAPKSEVVSRKRTRAS